MRGGDTFNIFFLLQNDTIYIIPYSFSQQNEFYKVLLYKKNVTVPQKTVFPPSLSFTASVPLQNYLQVFKYIHPLLSIESH